jgi:hypothetical protein
MNEFHINTSNHFLHRYMIHLSFIYLYKAALYRNNTIIGSMYIIYNVETIILVQKPTSNYSILNLEGHRR